MYTWDELEVVVARPWSKCPVAFGGTGAEDQHGRCCRFSSAPQEPALLGSLDATDDKSEGPRNRSSTGPLPAACVFTRGAPINVCVTAATPWNASNVAGSDSGVYMVLQAILSRKLPRASFFGHSESPLWSCTIHDK